ncbi:non-ribosomal peptide synthetase [Gordonia alkanivorans]|uniref:non-ribosomal peptide synthetase n=1 Tax=Gordonia alkanivorans TaxID=84096 RepID=UPI000FDDA8FC|nr:non-ribosomal peptide synthetase [Gordonia alkanivorans]AZZ81208.1 non-ribosomal peptide synthetase [Gordonia alkanivorans]
MTDLVQLSGTAGAPALVFGARRVSYAEFGARVSVLARELMAAGVGPDVAVGVCIERSVEMLVGIHAVVAAGGHYVPLDTSAPVERASYMLETSGARIVLVGAEGSPAVVEALGESVRTFAVDASEDVDLATPPISDEERRVPLQPDHAAYTLFTSGSTGRPKGVTVSHRAIVNRLGWMREWYSIKESDVFLQKTPVTFDVSVWELFLPLAVGATLVIAEPDRHGDPFYLADVVASERISVVHFVPSMLATFLDVLGPVRAGGLVSLRLMFTSGEALNPATAQAVLSALPAVELHNLYGPTEAAVDVTAHEVVPGESVVPIGVPVPSTSTYVLDARLQLVPAGVPGELYLGGVQLARGYAGQAGLTSERFVADRYGTDGGRLYRTGDLVRWNASGEIEYLGRTDFQVKLRGQRLELGEVESVISAVPGVVHAAATVARAGADDQLVAYVAPATVDLDLVRAAVTRALPEYMRPTVWMPLERMPLNSAGKVARRELPLPEVGVAEYVAPESDMEAMVAAVYADVLGLEQISVVESFFELGGNSLSATRVAARLADTLDLDVSVRDLFDTPSVRELVLAVAGRGRTLARLTAGERPERLPLSTAQARMWFINQFDPESPAYNIPMGLRLTGDLDRAALRDAVGDVIERHEVLRTVYPSDPGGPYQQIVPADRAREMLDWLEDGDDEELIGSATRGFDVTRDLPIRGRLKSNADGTVDIVVTAHHIAFDGESNPVFVRELLAAYMRRVSGGTQELPALPVQYADYALWQRSVLGDAQDPDSPMGAELAYWRAALADLPAVTDLPMDRPRPGVLDTAAALVSTTVDDAVAEALEAFAREHEVTPFMVSHAALAVAVSRLAATTDVVIGAPIAGRNDAALQDLIGMFVNTLVLRTPVDPARSLADFVRTVRSVDVDAFANSDVQFDDLVEELAPERSTAYQPLVQIAFTHESGDTRHASGALATAGLDAQALATAEPVAKFELTVGVTDRSADAPMAVNFLYATSLFDDATVQRFASVWLQVITAMVTDPQEAIGDVDILDELALDWMRPSRKSVGGFGTADDGGVTEPRTLVEVLASRPANPVRAALVCDGAEVSYAEFDERTNRVARQLIAHGVGPDDIVAVGLERSIASVIAVFGVVRTGAAYVPIDPSYPQDRIDYMIADSGVRWGITDIATRPRLGESSCEWLDIDEMSANVTVSGAPVTEDDRRAPVRLDNLAYLVYTSGSTGRPKAVGVTNRGIANFIDALGEVSGTPADNPDVRVLHVASPSFDASVLEMMWSIGLGHTLVIAPASEYAGDALGRILERDRVTDTLITPTVLATVDPARGRSLRNLVTGGEACPPELVERWAGVPGRRMFNFYGPSEATVWSSTGRTEPGRRVTIGRPVRGFSAYVLDGRLHQVPRGVVGELYLSAPDSLARGYLGRAGQTAASFVADPFSSEPGRRMYATGDMVRLTGDGEIEFAGRADDQVKINGQRVELGEIETVLADQPGVDSAVVLGHRDDSGRTRLVAYLVAARVDDAPVEVDVDAVLAAAATRLAGHMVPPVAMVLEELPVTPGGKLDRRALPAPETSTDFDDHVAPSNSTEEVLASIVAGLLGLDRVSVTESFFALGGDSIMSIQLASAAKASGLVLSPREIFEHKTIRAMAQAVSAGGTQLPVLDEPTGGPVGDLPLPAIVSWMVESSSSAGDFADFNQSMVLIAPAGATDEAVGEVLTAVVTAHPMLTARLHLDDDRWKLTTGTPFDPVSAVHARRVDALVGTQAFADEVRAAHVEAAGRLDPSTGNLVQAVLVTDASGAGRIVLVIHHLGVDAVSWPILIEDLVTVWAQRSNGHPISVRAEQTSARAWSHALDAQTSLRSGEVDHWLTQLPERPTDFGTAFDPEQDRYATTASVVHQIPAEVTEAVVTSVPEAFGGNVDDVLLATLGRAVRSWQADRGLGDRAPVSILSEGHGRYEDVVEKGADPRRADLSRTVGWFTTIAPVAIDPTADVVHAVKSAKEARLAAPDHGVGFGQLRYGADTPLARRPLPSIAFNYLGNRGGTGVEDQTAGTGAPTVQLDSWLPAGDAPFLPSTVDGRMAAMATLTVNAGTTVGLQGRTLSADFRFPQRILSGDDVRDIASRWSEELSLLVDHLAAHGDPGLSPSDVRGGDVTQDDLDEIEAAYPGSAVWPLSPLQRGLYFQAALAGDDTVDVYVTQAVIHLGGEIDLDRLRRATDDLLAHHRSLRSGFVRTSSGSTVAVIPASAPVPWETVDIDAVGPDEVTAAVATIEDAQRLIPFNLAAPPLLRVVAARHTDGVSVVITNHHILFDGWSGPLVLADLLALYATGATYTGQISDSRQDFSDYLAHIGAVDDRDGLAAWSRVLAPVEGPTLVASGTEATADLLPRDSSVLLDEDLSSAIEAVARTHGATVATVLQVAWAVLLSRLTGNRVVTFGETVSGRPADLDGVESMVGLFINTLPAVVDVDPRATVIEVLEKVQADKVSVLDHQYLGLPEIIAASGAPVGFDTLTVHESYPVDTDSVATADTGEGLNIRDVSTRDATHYPLNLITSQSGGRLTLKLKYLPGAFDDAQVHVFRDTLVEILRSMATQPDLPSADVRLASAASLEPIAERSTGRDVAVADSTVADAVAAVVAAGPAVPAVVFEGRSVSYAEFGARVNVLARELIGLGVGPDVAVGVCIGRSVEMVVAIHAVVAAGGQYVPIDTGAPADRVGYMIETADVHVVLTASDARPESLAELSDTVRIVAVDTTGDVDPAVVPVSDADRISPLRPDHALYTLFTSGSTGRPKGVTVSHRSVSNRLRWGLSEYPWGSSDRVVQKTPYTFDVSVPELFGPLLAGATMVLAAPGGHADPAYIADLIGEQHVTSVHFVPSMLSVFLDVVPAQRLRQLTTVKWVFASGEALPPAVVAAVRQIWPWAQVHNLFGPTEAAVEVAYADVSSAPRVIPIGVPVWNTATWVLDARLRPVPAGVPGELYLGGVQVARAYAGQPGLTAERFVADPFGKPGSRLYRTGDLVRWNTSGAIEYLGRTDFQVKLRGQRIELGEIESVIAAVPGVVHTAATVATTPAGGQQLVGYVAPSSVDLRIVQSAVAESLPEYMRPTVWMLIDDVVLSSAGKLDRKALPDPDFGGSADEFVAPTSGAERAVASVAADVLGLEAISVTASFFDIGGNSLSAMRLAARVSDVLGVDVSVRQVFETPTVRGLVAASTRSGAALASVVAVSPRPERIPLSFAQQRMWFINQLEPQAITYNIPAMLRFTGPLDVDALRRALVDVVQRHEILRTTFPAHEGFPFQSVSDPGEVEARLDWRVVDTQVEFETAITTGFDVSDQWPLRARLWKTDVDAHVFALVLHHIAADGQSMGPLVGDIATAYAARSSGLTPEFAPLEVQFADYAIWQHAVLGAPDDEHSVVGAQLAYWTEQLADLPDVLGLPTDRPRPPVASHRGRQVGFEIPAEVTARVATIAADHGVTPFMVVHAALSVVLARLSSSDDIAIGTPIAGRGQRALDPLVGMFVNTLVLRTGYDPGQSFTALLDAVRTTDLDAFAHSDVPFETLVDALNPARSQGFSPLTQVMLTFDQSAVAATVAPELVGAELAGLTVSSVAPPEVPAQVDLTVTVGAGEPGNNWSGTLTYAADLFNESTVVGLADRFIRVLADLTSTPDEAVANVAFASEDEDRLTSEWSRGPSAAHDPVLIPDRIGSAVRSGSRRTALIVGERRVSYREFGARVAMLARELIDAGLSPDTPVAVCIPRSVEMIVSIHAISAAGGQYVPVDVYTPVDRTRDMLTTAGVKTMLMRDPSDAPQVAEVADSLGIDVREVRCDDAVGSKQSPLTAAERRQPLRGEHAAYTLFTSGSTGVPKGVTVSHAAIANRLAWMQNAYPIDSEDVVIQKTPYTFDVSVWELFWPLMVGATLVVAEPDRHGEPDYLAEVAQEYGVSVMHFVPSMLSTFVEVLGANGLARLDSVRLVFTSGEALTAPTAREVLASLPSGELHNLYGPTEAAVDVTAYQVLADESTVPIGRPVRNTTTYVLDERLRPVPPGVSGEMYLGGVQIARGYVGQPKLTAERFIADPFGEPGSRLYRTGDRVRWNNAGALEYLGRVDFQVKLRGQRLELGEIEMVIAQVPDVVHVAVTVATSRAGDQLVAYVSPATVDVDAAKEQVSRYLPEYMRPSMWMLLDAMPLSSAGKVSRRDLPRPQVSAAEYVAPETEVERAVAAVFAEILGVERVGITESFFDLGGNSLAAARVVAQIREHHGLRVELAWLFSDATVKGIAARIAANNDVSGDIVITLRAQGARAPLFCVHPAGGLAWFYGGLAPYLADRPIYGLQDPHVVTGEPSITDARELATRYVEEIRQIQPRGPYHLLGWSVGGVIAHAMATQLRELGEDVAYLGVMDSRPEGEPVIVGHESPQEDVVVAEGTARVDPDGSAVVDVLGGWRELFDLGDDVQASTPEEVSAIIRTQIAGMGLLAEEQVERIMDSFASSDQVVMGYRPGFLDAHMYVFTATADKENPATVAAAWRPFVGGAIKNVDVATHHLGMANAEALAVIGPELERQLVAIDALLQDGQGTAE